MTQPTQHKKQTPQLRFPEFNYMWKKITLGDVGKISMCKRIFKHQTKEIDDIPFYKIGTFGKKANAYINRELFNEFKMKYSFPNKGEILIAASGATYGKTVVFDGSDSYFQDSNIVWIKNEESLVLNVFLNLCYQRIKWAVEESTIPRLYNNIISSTKVKVPLLLEQQKIATFLTAVDKRIALLEQKKNLLEDYKKGVMQQLFPSTSSGQVPKLRFKDENGEDFSNWEEKKLGEVCKIQKGKQLNKEFLTEKGLYPCQNGGIEPSGFTTDFNFLADTITISEGGNSCGYVNLMHTNFWCGGHCYALVNLLKSTNNSFLYQSLKYFQNQLMRLRVGSGLPNIQKGDIEKFRIEIPSPKEQQKIASFLSAIDKKIEKVNQQIEGMQQFKKGLLQQMFV